MTEHDVTLFAQSLGAKLASRSRHVCVFLGAGSSRSAGLPDVAALKTTVLDGLDAEQCSLFEQQLSGRTLEQALSRIRRIAALAPAAPGVDGLTEASAQALDVAVCRQIVLALDASAADLSPALHLAAWAARADYHLPVEIFTLNYDLVLERAFEALGVSYFDGFVGSLAARFRTDLVEAAPADSDTWMPTFLVRLWKLHGSVNWQWAETTPRHVLRLGQPVDPGNAAAIYPSDDKYEESRRVPFLVLQDRFRRALHHPETLLLVAGYSFGDAHLNEILFEAARQRPRTEIVAFCYGTPPDEVLAVAQQTPNLQVTSPDQAVLGGVLAPWTVPTVAPEELWQPSGFALGNFTHLARFLARSSPPEGELTQRLAELLAAAAASAHV